MPRLGKVFMTPIILMEREPYRYVDAGVLDNGTSDYRIQKLGTSGRYKDIYLCDNAMQIETAMEDFEYTKWLDPDPEVRAYSKQDD